MLLIEALIEALVLDAPLYLIFLAEIFCSLTHILRLDFSLPILFFVYS